MTGTVGAQYLLYSLFLTDLDEPVQANAFCTPNPCKNGGNCISNPDSFTCKCQHAYAGNMCEICKLFPTYLFIYIIQLCSGITRGRVCNGDFDAQRL